MGVSELVPAVILNIGISELVLAFYSSFPFVILCVQMYRFVITETKKVGVLCHGDLICY